MILDWLGDFSKAATNLTVIVSFFCVVLGLIWRNYMKVKKILYQVTNNGGKTMKDSIDRVVDKVDKILLSQTVNVKRTQLLWEHQGQGYYECDADTGICTYANENLTKLFGLTLAEFLGFGWLAAVETQAERNRIYISWLAAVRDSIPYQEEYVIVVGGERIKVKTKAWACKDDSGKVLKMFGTLEKVIE